VLRKRLVTVLTLNEGVLFRTKVFEPDYRYTLNFVDAWSVDEVVLLDISRRPDADRAPFFAAVERFAKRCFVPLAAGGGVRSVEDFHRLLAAGADKVVVNTGALDRPSLLTEAARLFGAQCVVLSMDVRREADGAYQVYSHFGTRPSGLDPVRWAQRAQELGAGEILVSSIDRDGSLEGYDTEVTRRVVDAVAVPVLVCGGAGAWQHFVDGFRAGGVSAVCTTNVYHFTETSIRSAKRYLTEAGIAVREA
jgi:imidazole glycerol-phosphate synthase subunit HisF